MKDSKKHHQWHVGILEPSMLPQALNFIHECNTISLLEAAWAETHLQGFVQNLPNDFYEVIISYRESTQQIQSLIIFRKRPLTLSTYEIGQIIVSYEDSNDVTVIMIRFLLKILESRGSQLVFLELRDHLNRAKIEKLIQQCGFSHIGSVPHLCGPGHNADYFARWNETDTIPTQ